MAQQIEYKVNDVEVPFTGVLPDPDTYIVLDDTASIGYPDVVDRTQCTFKVITQLTTTEEDTAEYDAWLACSPILLDGGVVLTDDDEILTD